MRASNAPYGRLSGRSERRSRALMPPPANYKFDEASGLQYTETTSAMTGQDDRGWLHVSDLITSTELGKSCTQRADSHRRLGRGTRSLQETLNEFIVQNISRFSLDGIAFLPSRLVENLWNIIRKRSDISFHVFAIFSAILGKGATMLGLLKHQTQIISQRSPLNTYTIPLTSKSFDFLTILSITTPVNVVDLVKLSSVTNLVALEVVSSVRQSNTGVSDRLVRAWSFAAQDDGAFPLLRILNLWNHVDVTTQSVSYLNSFPVLAVYDIRGCDIKMNGKIDLQHTQWSACMNQSVLNTLEAKCDERRKHLEGSHSGNFRSASRLTVNPSRQCSKAENPPQKAISRLLAQPELTVATPPLDIPSIPKRPRKKQSRKNAQSEAWDFPLYTSLARIGELRSDRDIHAQISTDIQEIAGKDLVSSYPTASFRLGPTLPCLEPVNVSMQSYDLAFIRTSLPRRPQSNAAIPEASSTQHSSLPLPSHKSNPRAAQMHDVCHSEMPNGSTTTTTLKTSDPSRGNTTQATAAAGYVSSKPHPKIARQQPVSAVPKHKRRKLDDVLKAFF